MCSFNKKEKNVRVTDEYLYAVIIDFRKYESYKRKYLKYY